MKKIYHSIVADEKKYLWLLFLVAFATRMFLIAHNSFVFRWDQARDAIISRKIIEEKDLKIQGPSASGTQDQIYHGVLYYYLISPLYTFSGGDPRLVILVLTWIFSSSVYPVYYLTKSFLKSKTVAFWVTFLFALSVDTASLGTWLSNPIMALFFIPLFYWRLWQVFFLQKKDHLWLLAVALGLSNQAVISTLYLFIPLGLAYLYLAYQKRNLILFSIKEYLLLIGVYIGTISTIILSQYQMWKAGIFKLTTFTNVVAHDSSWVHNLPLVLNLYLRKIQFNLIPQSSSLSLLIFLPLLIYFLSKIKTKQRWFYLIYISGVFVFLMIHYRNSLHGLVGLSWAVLLPLGFFLKEIWVQSKNIIIPLALAVTLALLHLSKSAEFRRNRYALYAVDQGYFFDEKLALARQLYQITAGKPFSISTFTIPYGHNTTWAYLLGWYGKKTFGYRPLFYGPDQTGIFGADYMKMTAQPLAFHFTIYEPSVGSYESELRLNFAFEQNKIAPIKDEFNFGTLEVKSRRPN